eukprot:2598162-Prymnesium_polylepis.1
MYTDPNPRQSYGDGFNTSPKRMSFMADGRKPPRETGLVPLEAAWPQGLRPCALWTPWRFW